MPVQGTIVLDSGAFLTDEEENLVAEVGYFRPILIIYNDKEGVNEIKLPKPKEKGALIHVRHYDARGNEITDGVRLSSCLVKSLLRIKELYEDKSSPTPKGEKVVEDCQKSQFDYVFRFTSGNFRSSMVKRRFFKEFDPSTLKETGRRRKFPKPIAHDIIVSFDLKYNECLKLFVEKNGKEKKLWASTDERGIETRFDIEIIAENDTAMDYFCHAVKPKNGQKVWVPNAGEPPPQWRHDGSTGLP
jgi:hypothetical protein